MTFRQLYDEVCAIGSALIREGYFRQPVMVLMEKRAQTIAAFLGVVAAGCFYVPVDVRCPRQRVAMLMEQIHPAACICDEATISLAQSLPEAGRCLLCRTLAQCAVDDAALQAVRERQIDADPMYVVFTSGSTGTAKGVVGSHRGVLDYVQGLCQVLSFDRDTIFGNQTPLHVDACLKEIIPTLKYGATTCLIPEKLFLQPVKLIEYLNQQKVNTICWVASALALVSSLGTLEKIRPKYLRTVTFASEVLPIRQLNRWRQAAPEAGFYNLYGPTEATGICCWYALDRDFSEGETVPIGWPLPNTDVFLLNAYQQIPPPGEQGEICIRGTRLTFGYYGNQEATRGAFVQNPLNPCYPERIYRTGDIGRYNSRGELEFISRKDNQIKHMGHRIELGDIEAAAAAQEAVQTACCIYAAKRQWIFLYYTGDLTPGELMERLRERLPRYLLPQRICRLDSMPLTANGKLDRKELQQRSEANG